MEIKPYRPNVIAAFTNADMKFLVCQRTGKPNSWQFPQGGIDPGESPIEALYREMQEELGCKLFSIQTQASQTVCYDFPADLGAKIADSYRGQEQYWFHTIFDDKAAPDLALADDEFSDLKWISIRQVIDGIVEWKKEAYLKGLGLLGFSI